MHENKIARMHKIARSQICTKPNLHKGTKMYQGTSLHEDDSAQRVNFARVTFLNESKNIKKTEKKN